MKPKKILIITSSGGGGLLQAAIAKEQEIRAQDPTAIIIKRDMMRDWYWKIIGKFGIFAWDWAQRKGDVATLERLLQCQGTGDIIFWPRVFLHAIKTIFREEVDRVIDTQCLCTSAILQAIRIYNARKNKNVILEKVIVDLPTKSNTHFLKPIKGLSAKNRELIRLISIPPLVQENETWEQFWQRYCRLSESAVRYETYPIRQAFMRYKGVKRLDHALDLKVHFANGEERKFLERCLERGPLRAQIEEKSARLQIGVHDKVITILLGSQPAFGATLGYVKRFLRLAREEPATAQRIDLFVLCALHRVGQDSLLRRVADLVAEMRDYPEQMSVVPLSFQSDEVIAPLLHRTDLALTRSGGQTAMELMCVNHGEKWIHSEAKRPKESKEELTLEQLLKGIPGWEAGNALYLHKLYEAKVVTPDSIISLGRSFLQADRRSVKHPKEKILIAN